MDELTASFGALSLNRQCSDLVIRCEGRTYYVHKAIVCSKSNVFARECDGAFADSEVVVIEHTSFDALTLGRMLQFMYTGDYTVDICKATVNDEHWDTGSATSFGRSASDDKVAKALPPPARRRTAQELLVKTSHQLAENPPSTRFQIAATQPALAHVFVYAIADHYDLADLKDLALQKYIHPNITIYMDEFADVIEEVYKCTWTENDPLRLETVQTALEQVAELIGDKTFMQALAQQSALQEFASQLLPRAVTQTGSCAMQIEALQLAVEDKDHELNSMRSASQKASEELQVLLIQHLKLTERFDNLNLELGKSMQRHEKALQEAEKAQRAAENAHGRAALLDHQLSQKVEDLDAIRKTLHTLEWTDRSRHIKITSLEQQLRLKSDEVKTARADCTTAKERARALESEKDTARDKLDVANRDLKLVKKSRYSAEAKVRKRNLALNEAMTLLNETYNCRNPACGQPITGGYFDWDYRTGMRNAGLMLRCQRCQCKHFGKLIE